MDCRNVRILWLKVLGLEVGQREQEVVEGDMKTLKLSKEDALVRVFMETTD